MEFQRELVAPQFRFPKGPIPHAEVPKKRFRNRAIGPAIEKDALRVQSLLDGACKSPDKAVVAFGRVSVRPRVADLPVQVARVKETNATISLLRSVFYSLSHQVVREPHEDDVRHFERQDVL